MEIPKISIKNFDKYMTIRGTKTEAAILRETDICDHLVTLRLLL